MQKHANLVDLGESFPTSIYLQNLVSIQPRTSPSKFGGKLFNLIQSCPKSAASLHQLRRPSGLDNLETSGFDSFEASARSEWGKSIRGNPKLAPDVAPQRVRHRVLYVLYRFWSNRFWNSLILSGFRDDSREEWRGSLFQSDVRKQIRKLPKILKVVKIIQYYSIFFFQ